MIKHISFRVGFIIIGIVALLAIGLMWLQQNDLLLATALTFSSSTKHNSYNPYNLSFGIATVNRQPVKSFQVTTNRGASVLVPCAEIQKDNNQLVVDMSDGSQLADAAKGIDYSVEVKSIDGRLIGSANKTIYQPGKFSLVITPFNCEQMLATPYKWINQSLRAQQYWMTFTKTWRTAEAPPQTAIVALYLQGEKKLPLPPKARLR